jgi:hypothetical protein
MRLAQKLIVLMSGASDTTAPTCTISLVSASGAVAAMQIVFSEEVAGFVGGDITISAGGSLANFATADNITFTVSWTLAAGANTMDVAGSVCQDAAGNNNTAATQYALTYLLLQPDAAAGLDTLMYSADAAGNYGLDTRCIIGNNGATARTLIKFDLTSITAGATIRSAVLSLYATADSSTNARAFRVYRTKRAWVELNATWTRWAIGNNWSTAGGFHVDDCEQTDIGSRNMTATETMNEFKDWTLTASKIQEMIPSGVFTNNGFLMMADTESGDWYEFSSSDAATAGNRPKLQVIWSNP